MLTALLASIGMNACAFVEEPATVPAVAIVGTVVDAGRRPAAGASVSYSVEQVGGGWGADLARTQTDDRGRFRLEVPAAPGGGPRPGILWAYRPGAMVATRPIAEDSPRDEPVSMVLDEPAHAEFLIRGPDGRPIAGARIRPQLVRIGESGEWAGVPDELARRIADRTVTDADGRAVLSAFFPEDVSAEFISAPGLGRQYGRPGWFDPSRGVREIRLPPVGRIEGTVVADDPEIARGLKLTITVWDTGLLEVRTDARGRFAIPEAPVGELGACVTTPAGSSWFLRAPEGLKVEAGRTTRVELRAAKGVRLRGRVLERRTGAPIAGVGLFPYRDEGSEDAIVRTDAEGRFSLFDSPGGPNIWVAPPEGYAFRMFSLEYPEIPTGVAEFDLPAVTLSRAGTARGVVVDERGAPVPGAVVTASWPVNEGPRAMGRQRRRVVAGRRGEFRVGRVDVGSPVDLSAVAPDGRRTLHAVESGAAAEPARLVCESSVSVSLAGRVVDAAGRRVADARVHIRVQEYDVGEQPCGDALVEIRGAYVIQTREDGWFRTPTSLDPKLLYVALVEADGYEPARTPWTAGRSRTFSELVLRPRTEPVPAAVDSATR
jgi:hypothetical protein